jgi:hypothetical protein
MGFDVTPNNGINTFSENKANNSEKGNIGTGNDNLPAKPLDLHLPELISHDTLALQPLPQSKDKEPKNINFVDDSPMVSMTDSSKSGATMEFGLPGKALLKMKVSKEVSEGKTSVSFDSPFVRDYALDKGRQYLAEPLDKNFYEPLKENMGKTMADTTLTAVAFATVMAVSRHLPSGNAKLPLPTGSFIENNFKARLLVGYGNTESARVKGFDLRKEFFVSNSLIQGKNVEVKATVEKKEITAKREAVERGLEVNMRDAYRKSEPNTLGMYLKKNDATGQTVGVTYELSF